MEKSSFNEKLLKDWRNRKIQVFRITVDEKLMDNAIRVLICPLVKDIEDFAEKQTQRITITDNARNWDAEHEFIVIRRDFREFLQTLGLITESIILPSWEDLKEGQVFYAGHVRCEEIRLKLSVESTGRKSDDIKFEKGAKMQKKYVVDLNQWNLYQVDDVTKEATRRLYFSVLKTGRRHASSTN